MRPTDTPAATLTLRTLPSADDGATVEVYLMDGSLLRASAHHRRPQRPRGRGVEVIERKRKIEHVPISGAKLLLKVFHRLSSAGESARRSQHPPRHTLVSHEGHM